MVRSRHDKDKLDGWYFEDSVHLTKGHISMLKYKSYQRGILTNLHVDLRLYKVFEE